MISIVSGLPRCGTSLMMQMLAAGGMPVLTDGLRKADADNPRGYFELEKVKQIKKNSSWLSDADGKVFKMISMLLYDLPAAHDYKIVFMTREMNEILASQARMLERCGKSVGGAQDEELRRHFASHLAKLNAWFPLQSNMRVLFCNYNDLMREPEMEARRIAEFLDVPLDIPGMVNAVDPSLYRNRKGA